MPYGLGVGSTRGLGVFPGTAVVGGDGAAQGEQDGIHLFVRLGFEHYFGVGAAGRGLIGGAGALRRFGWRLFRVLGTGFGGRLGAIDRLAPASMKQFVARQAAVRPLVKCGADSVKEATPASTGDVGGVAMWTATGWHTGVIDARG
jgi:hypothetical protein